MLLDTDFYEKNIQYFDENIRKIFNGDMMKISEEKHFEHMGNFTLVYKYIPYEYTVNIESEFRVFNIIFKDSEGASNVLYRVKKYNTELCEKNIIESLSILKDVLEQNNFNMYLYIDDKIYVKNKHGIKRVKDISSLSNG